MRPERWRYLADRVRMVRWLQRERRLTGLVHAAAFLRVPRHLFVDPDQRSRAYAPGTLPTDEGQTVSGVDHVALMTSLLRIRPGHRVLEVGTGTGYQAAVLAALGARVTSVEIRRALHDRAVANHDVAGVRGVDLRLGDGATGATDAAPFDGIVLACVPHEIPPALLEQLAPGGRLVGPEGDPARIQALVLVEKRPDGLHREVIRSAWFVPMVGPEDLEVS